MCWKRQTAKSTNSSKRERRKRKIDQVVNCCRSVFPPQSSIHLFRDQGFQRENGVELINPHILAVLVKAKNLRITIQVISCLQEKLPALETEFWTLYVQCYKLQPCIYVTCQYKTSQFGKCTHEPFSVQMLFVHTKIVILACVAGGIV